MSSPCAPYIPAVLPPRVGAMVTVVSSTPSFPDNTWLAFVYSTVLFDSHAFFTAGANHLVVPAGQGGLYAVTGSFHWLPGGVQNSSQEIRLDIGGVVMGDSGFVTSGYQSQSAILPLASGQEVILAAKHFTGVVRTIDWAMLAMFKVGQ